MKTAIAILTYRRLHALKEMLTGVNQHCTVYPLAIFEDCGQRDGTSAFLQKGRIKKERRDLLAEEWVVPPERINDYLSPEEILMDVKPNIPRHFLATENLGVAGNSNRAIRWFMEETDCDHLCLCNDDLHVLGDFAAHYGRGHQDLGVGMFCYAPFGGIYSDDSYKGVTVRTRGYAVKLMTRYTGIMISITRKLVEKVGYFDARFGKFGEEHCDYTIRARFGGGIKLDGIDQPCLDLDPTPPVLRHQEIETSVTGLERQRADREASLCMRAASDRYRHEHYFQPFALKLPRYVGTFGNKSGIPFTEVKGHALVPYGA